MVYLVFDRYDDLSIENSMQTSGGKEGSRVFKLHHRTPFSSQNLTLTVTGNKQKLTDNWTRTPAETLWWSDHTDEHPATNQEADSIIVQQAMHTAVKEHKYVTVITSDNYVYILLLYHYL